MASPSLIATLGLNGQPFYVDLTKAKGFAQTTGQEIGGSFGQVAQKLKSLFGAVAIEEAVRHTIQYGEHIDMLALRLGMTAEAAARWDAALKMSNSSLEEATIFFEKLAVARQKVLKGGNEDMAHAFHALGVEIDDLKNKRIEDIAEQIGRTFERGDPQALLGSLREVGGRGAGEMIAAFRNGLVGQFSAAGMEFRAFSDDTIGQLHDIAVAGKTTWQTMTWAVGTFTAESWRLLKEMGASIQASWAGLKGLTHGLLSGSLDDPFGLHEGAAAMRASQIEHEAKLTEEQRKRQEKQDKARKNAGLDDDEPTKKEKREEEKLLHLHEEAKRIRESTALAELDAAGKVLEIQKRINELKQSSAGLLTPKGGGALDFEAIGKADVEMAKLESELERAKKQEEKADSKTGKGKLDKPDVNQLQRIGAYAPDASQMSIADATRKSEEHLKVIRETLRDMAKVSGGTKY